MTTFAPHHEERGRLGRGTPPPPGVGGRTYGLLAEFDSPAAIHHAAQMVRDAGFRWWDCHVPFPVHGLDKAMGVQPTFLPWFVMGAGVSGALSGLCLQFFTNSMNLGIWAFVPVIGYQFEVSGKPLNSLPAFIPVIFELTILLSAISAVVFMLIFNGLPRLHHPLFKSERFLRATDDRFFVLIEARDPKFSRTKTQEFLSTLNPLSIETVEE